MEIYLPHKYSSTYQTWTGAHSIVDFGAQTYVLSNVGARSTATTWRFVGYLLVAYLLQNEAAR